MDEQIIIFCPDCCGKFDVEQSDIIEDDILECRLCGAEILVVQEDPIRLKLVGAGEEV